MKLNIQIKTIFGKVLFELEKEDNSIKKTLIEAVKRGADLRGAYLRGADLQGADLQGADLQGADLPMFSKWSMIKLENTFKIGCKEKSFEDWDKFFDSDKEFETKRESDDFKRIHAMYLANKTYYEFLKN
jgi:hypothetical protein